MSNALKCGHAMVSSHTESIFRLSEMPNTNTTDCPIILAYGNRLFPMEALTQGHFESFLIAQLKAPRIPPER